VLLVSVKSDEELLVAAKAGDSEAGSLLLGKYRQRLVRFMRSRLGNSAVAEDVAQDALLDAFRGLQGFRGDCSLYTWLCTIAIRKAYRQPPNSLKTESEMVTHTNPETLLGAKQEVWQVLDNMKQLPHKQQAALYYKVYENMSYADIGYTLNCSPMYAKKLVHYAKKKIRKEINGQ